MAKNNQKCIRMSDEVLAYVESMNGEGFNQKFENCVYFIKQAEKEKTKKIKTLDEEIERKEQKIKDLAKSINNIQDFLWTLDKMKNSIENGQQNIEILANKIKEEQQ
ncbi:MAG: hypothetical protein RSB38_00180 [Oscillospiraceae bacterium]